MWCVSVNQLHMRIVNHWCNARSELGCHVNSTTKWALLFVFGINQFIGGVECRPVTCIVSLRSCQSSNLSKYSIALGMAQKNHTGLYYLWALKLALSQSELSFFLSICSSVVFVYLFSSRVFFGVFHWNELIGISKRAFSKHPDSHQDKQRTI